jgi:hypothetical protein
VWVILGYIVGGLGYLAVNRLVGDGPFHHLTLPLDVAIPFLPVSVLAYMLVYVTPAMTGFFLTDRAELYRTFLAFGLNCVICFTIFILYPVEYPRVVPIPDTIFGRPAGVRARPRQAGELFPVAPHRDVVHDVLRDRAPGPKLGRGVRRGGHARGGFHGVREAALRRRYSRRHRCACLTYFLSFPPRKAVMRRSRDWCPPLAGSAMQAEIVVGDLLQQDVDVIVNAWNRNIIPWWLLLPQGVSGRDQAQGGDSSVSRSGTCWANPSGGRNPHQCWTPRLSRHYPRRGDQHAVACFRGVD